MIIMAFLFAQCIKSVTSAKKKKGYIRHTIVQDIVNILDTKACSSGQNKILVGGWYGFGGYEIEISGNINENIIHEIVSYCVNYDHRYKDIHSFRISFRAGIDDHEYLTLEVDEQ